MIATYNCLPPVDAGWRQRFPDRSLPAGRKRKRAYRTCCVVPSCQRSLRKRERALTQFFGACHLAGGQSGPGFPRRPRQSVAPWKTPPRMAERRPDVSLRHEAASASERGGQLQFVDPVAAVDVVVAIGHSTSFQRCSPPSLPTLRRRAAAEMVCAATAGGETSRSRNKPAVAHDKPKVALLHDGSEDRKYAAQRVARTVRRL